MSASLVGSEMCIRDSASAHRLRQHTPAEPASPRPGRAPSRRPALRSHSTCGSGSRAWWPCSRSPPARVDEDL
eukprot:13570603-Alexandrium_andersonii.AAC.1